MTDNGPDGKAKEGIIIVKAQWPKGQPDNDIIVDPIDGQKGPNWQWLTMTQ